jgi:3-deoxy-manno-octulosonate cytidylyltransferase (CMP-KDO synthetase)
MRTIAFIPARYDSKRFPGKALARIGGRPMIQRVYQRALACPEINEVFVVTDDGRISDCVAGFEGKALLTPNTLPSGTDRIGYAVARMRLSAEDIVVNIQGDQPLFHPGILKDLIRPLQDDPGVGMTTLEYRIKDESEIEDPKHVKVVTDERGFALYFSRSPIPFFRDSESGRVYYKHLGFYAYRSDILSDFLRLPIGPLESAEKLEQLRALEHGLEIKVVETPFDSFEVDTPEDILKAEALLGAETPSG